MDSEDRQSNREPLRSQKEIAAFLGVTARSVQRWEKSGLPLHRQGNGTRGRVHAYPDELERWLDSGGLHRAREADRAEAAGRVPAEEETPHSHRRRYLYLLLFLPLAAALLLLWKSGRIRPAARVPHGFTLANSRLSVFDEAERSCWSKTFPRFDKRFDHDVRDKVVIADIDDDGLKEVLFSFLPESSTRARGSLMCFEHDGRLRWEFLYGEEKTFAGRHFDSLYKGNLVVPARISGKPVLLTAANHLVWYPAQIALLDVHTGRLIEEYWHPGSVYSAFVRDIDRDGVDELVFAAINNPGEGLGHAALGALKLPFSHAPRAGFAGDDPLRPLTGGGELDYVLFPLSDIAKATAMLQAPADMSPRGADRIFLETQLPEAGGLVYYLDFHFNVQDWRPSDNFAPLHQRFFAQGLLDHALSSKEVASLRRVPHFRAAPNANLPEVNRMWNY